MRIAVLAVLLAVVPADAFAHLGTLAVPVAYAGTANGPVVGLADFHNHQFAYLGFGGMAINHSVNPEDVCLPPLPFDKNSFLVRDVIRQAIYEPASISFANGNCAPALGNMASQRVDVDNLKRAWEYGLRLVVMMAVHSEFMCMVAQLATSCPSDLVAIEQQLLAARALEAKIDTAAGGPGRGWYRIVTTPQEARRAIVEGKLAVVLGIEAPNAFGCTIVRGYNVTGISLPGVSPAQEASFRRDCGQGMIDNPSTEPQSFRNNPNDPNSYGTYPVSRALAMFERYWQLGVRHFYLIHNMNGIAGGTALSISLLHGNADPSDTGQEGVNAAIRAVRPGHASWNCSSRFPFDGGRCNVLGLNDLGRALAQIMAAHGALIDADHLSFKARQELLADNGPLGSFLYRAKYPLVSSHGGFNELGTGNENHEGQLSLAHTDGIAQSGGAFAPRLPAVTTLLPPDHAKFPNGTYPPGASVVPHGCPGTSESFVQTYRFFIDRLRAGRMPDGRNAFVGIGIGTDFGPPIPLFALPRFRTSGNITAVSVGTPTGRHDVLVALGQVMGSKGPKTPPPGYCYNAGTRPAVSYPFRSPYFSYGMQFGKSTTPWDLRRGHRGYDISYDGVVHVGMLPDFVEEMRILGMTEQDLYPLWQGAEAYLRSWENADKLKGAYDVEGNMGVRTQCEALRRQVLDFERKPAPTEADKIANTHTRIALKNTRCRFTQ